MVDSGQEQATSRPARGPGGIPDLPRDHRRPAATRAYGYSERIRRARNPAPKEPEDIRG